MLTCVIRLTDFDSSQTGTRVRVRRKSDSGFEQIMAKTDMIPIQSSLTLGSVLPKGESVRRTFNNKIISYSLLI